jgi:hypothetical protein
MGNIFSGSGNEVSTHTDINNDRIGEIVTWWRADGRRVSYTEATRTPAVPTIVPDWCQSRVTTGSHPTPQKYLPLSWP